jgi:hypothetical protein
MTCHSHQVSVVCLAMSCLLTGAIPEASALDAARDRRGLSWGMGMNGGGIRSVPRRGKKENPSRQDSGQFGKGSQKRAAGGQRVLVEKLLLIEKVKDLNHRMWYMHKTVEDKRRTVAACKMSTMRQVQKNEGTHRLSDLRGYRF